METCLSFYIGNFCLLLVEYFWDTPPMRLQKKEAIDTVCWWLFMAIGKKTACRSNVPV